MAKYGFTAQDFNFTGIPSTDFTAQDFNFTEIPSTYDFTASDFNFGIPTDSQFNLGAGNNINQFDFNKFPSSTGAGTSKGFDLAGQGGANIAAGIQGVSSLASALAGFKQLKLGKQQLNQNRAAFNRNLANQATLINAQLEDRARRRAAGNQTLAGDFAAIEAAAQRNAARSRVSGAPI